MLKSLSYSVTFPKTGRTLKADIGFQKGVGVITGANEAGKSFSMEMVRYALFGSAALRGKAEDYKTLKVNLEFKVRGADYKVVRTNTSCVLSCAGEDLAVGTKPVNSKILSLFGYGLDVFDIANMANQNDLLRLSDMKPAERKAMVDSVIGLGVLDNVSKWANDQALDLSREAEARLRVVREPQQPVAPVGYKPSNLLDDEFEALKLKKTELDQLVGFLKNQMKPPVKPSDPNNIPSEQLKIFVEKQDEIRARLSAIKLPPAPPPYSETELTEMLGRHDKADLWDEYQRALKLHPRPDYTIEQLNQWDQDWLDITGFNSTELLRKELDEALNKGVHECPNCAHQWPVAAEQVDRLKADIALGVHTKPEKPPITVRQIVEQRDRHADTTVVEVAEEAKRPHLSRKELNDFLFLWSQQGDRAGLEAELKSLKQQLENAPDYRAMYQKQFAYEQAMPVYIQQLQGYNEWLEKKNAAEVRVGVLEDELKDYHTLQVLLQTSKWYEHLLVQYENDQKGYDEQKKQIDELQATAANWKKAKAAIGTLRVLIKQHLLPSLNKVASSLLHQMTGGQRNVIVVDDDFDVTVDGQAINTLSGSGQAVVNLALRIGLGQVLTNGVFSVFIGDEIDASMDANRAQNTANTLQLLKNKVSQILLVTHKYLDGDYHIEIGTNENPTGSAGRAVS